MSSSSTIYTDFVLNEKLISPKNGYTCRRLTRQNIKQFGFNSIDDLREQYPDFPLHCPETLERLSLKSKTATQPMEAKAKRIEEYSLNPSRCIQCDCILEYKRKRNKFCNPSCSATFNNMGREITVEHKYKISQSAKAYAASQGKNIREKYSGQSVRIRKARITKSKPKIDKDEIPAHLKLYIISCQKALGVEVVTWAHFQKAKDIFQDLIHKGLSGQQIADRFGINRANFVGVLVKVFNLKMLSTKERLKRYNENFNPNHDKKVEYKRDCAFKFEPFRYPDMKGYSELLERGIYHSVMNPNGMCRDHIISKEYGWENNIDPKIISHPANCQFLSNSDNSSKGTRSDMSIEELMALINGNAITSRTIQKRVTRSEDHKRKIGIANKGLTTITNGITNKRAKISDPIPDGFWRGCTRRNKLANTVC